MHIKQINDMKIKTIPLKKIDKKDIVGGDMFDLYPNIFICAKKKSGKTTCIFNILKACTDKNTLGVYVFCSTYTKDANWLAIHEMLDKKKVPNKFFSSIFDEKTNNLHELIEAIQDEESEEEKEEEEEMEPPIVIFDDDRVKVTIKKKKPKKISQRYVIIFDDLSSDLKDPNVSHLLKKNRHLKTKIIISSQYILDIAPMSRRQIDIYMLFSGLNEDKLMEVFRNADLNIEFPVFMAMYHKATEDKYAFFYINSSECQYRINFDKEIII